MGNGVRKLNLCFAGDVGEISKRYNDIAMNNITDPLDEGLGHSFCYIRPDPKTNPFSDDSSSSSTTTTISSVASTTTFRTISGASISANTFTTPLSTAIVDFSGCYNHNNNAHLDKASAFESSQFFSSIPLQPIPRGSCGGSIHSGPIPARVSNPGLNSGPIERGFMSGPIERSFASGPLENQYNDHIQRYKPKSKKWGLIKSLKKVLSSSFLGFKEVKLAENNANNNNEVVNVNSRHSNVGNILSSQNSLADDDDEGSDSFRGQNVQWAQGKAGEDRVHVVISEEHGWVFVGIYDGFNGPDATDFLLSNLYSNVYKELKGLLWNDKSETTKNATGNNETVPLRNSGFKVEHFVKNNEEFDHGVFGVDHSDVLKALSEGLRKTEASYLEIADMMVKENPELALMGSCVLVMLLKGQDVYLLNVGDSRAVLAQNPESDHSMINKFRRINEQSVNSIDALYRTESDRKHNLVPSQLTMDHSTSIKEEILRIRSEHPDDPLAIKNDRVKGSLKVTRAFGAGYLKQGDPAQHLVEEVLFRAAKKAGINFHELLDIPQGDRRKYHDDVSIIILSFEGRIWKSSM
ncbi:hypothetical protein RND71_038725 [Anisodus tanguticus]|uniref:PPM-type phosphatase domain-containing protein n=1 Tax=Anisodus tanguticus TaxID=243964 RepID=A0AAE1UZE8_9SOLA|nr:hypothetical protein RND71_038725 [Anisodus tanguticus]